MPTQLRDGQTLLFIGDSITDCGRREPVHAPLGIGYVRLFHDLLIAREPEKSVRILNRGIGGNTVFDLRSRWTDDALAHRPDWLSIKIGINDLNQHLNRGDDWLSPKTYEATYRELLVRTRDALPETRLLLISPFYLSRDTASDSYRSRVAALLPKFIASVAALADEFGALYVPLNDIFSSHLDRRHADVVCPEPVHPNLTGHLIIADAVYQTLSGD
ncbi:MAG: GDSL family lipase [Puniceicoccaceae bacterium]|nr:MAG: GDSL family lipase [Puniceicoccaceae bacterium]